LIKSTPGQQVSQWLDVHNKVARQKCDEPPKKIVSFHEAMEARFGVKVHFLKSDSIFLYAYLGEPNPPKT
jgi:hypothetical protein